MRISASVIVDVVHDLQDSRTDPGLFSDVSAVGPNILATFKFALDGTVINTGRLSIGGRPAYSLLPLTNGIPGAARTDGNDLVWFRGEGGSFDSTLYDRASLVTWPYSTTETIGERVISTGDPDLVYPSIPSRGSSIFPTLIVSHGHAAYVGYNQLHIVRLSDGRRVDLDPPAGQRWTSLLLLTEREVVVASRPPRLTDGEDLSVIDYASRLEPASAD